MGTVLSSLIYTPEGIPYYTYDDFNGLKRVGDGAYSTVKRGNVGRHSLHVAVKEFHLLDGYSDREIQLLKGAFHPNIIETYGVIWDGTCDPSTRKPIYSGYVMEYMALGSLDNRIYDFSTNYDNCLISKWIQQIGDGLQYLHKKSIIHRDIKPKNILLASEDHLKLADFGLARSVSGRESNTAAHWIGTDSYKAPEVLISRNYGRAADVFSFGVTIWEIIHRKHPWQHVTASKDSFGNDCVDLPMEENKIHVNASDFIRRCWQTNISDRPSIAEIIEFGSNFEQDSPGTIIPVGHQLDQIQETVTIQGNHFDSIDRTLDGIPPNIDKLKTILIKAIGKEKQLEVNTLEAKKGELERKIRQLDLVADELDKLKEETRGNLTEIKQQIKSNTDNEHSLQLQISKDSSKVNQIQGTITNQGKRLDYIDRTLDGIPQNIDKLKTILIMGGGDQNDDARRTMTVLSTDRSVWIELQLELPYDVAGSGAVFLHNELYVVGGGDNPKGLYKLDENLEWKQLADMNVGRKKITNSCLEANGYIWVFGGKDGDENDLKSVERYDPKENKWTLMPDMPTGRSNAAAVFWKDRIIVCGGWSEKEMTSSAECFLLEIGEWIQLPPVPDRLYGHSLVSYENKLILMGGWNDGYLKSVWELDSLQPNDGWKSLPSKEYACAHSRGLVLDQEIYALGGYHDRSLDRVEIFDGKSWRDGPSLPYGRWCHSAVVIPKSLANRIYQYKSTWSSIFLDLVANLLTQ